MAFTFNPSPAPAPAPLPNERAVPINNECLPLEIRFPDFIKKNYNRKKIKRYALFLIYVLVSILIVMACFVQNVQFMKHHWQITLKELSVYVAAGIAVYIFIWLSKRAEPDRFHGIVMVFFMITYAALFILFEISGINTLFISAGQTTEDDDKYSECRVRVRNLPKRENFVYLIISYSGIALLLTVGLVALYFMYKSFFQFQSGRTDYYFLDSSTISGKELYFASTLWVFFEAIVVGVISCTPLVFTAYNRNRYYQREVNNNLPPEEIDLKKDKTFWKAIGTFASFVCAIYLFLHVCGAFDEYNKGFCRDKNNINRRGNPPGYKDTKPQQIRHCSNQKITQCTDIAST